MSDDDFTITFGDEEATHTEVKVESPHAASPKGKVPSGLMRSSSSSQDLSSKLGSSSPSSKSATDSPKSGSRFAKELDGEEEYHESAWDSFNDYSAFTQLLSVNYNTNQNSGPERNNDFNSRLQDILEQDTLSQQERSSVSKRVQQLLVEFNGNAAPIVQKIVQESNMDDKEKTIKPINDDKTLFSVNKLNFQLCQTQQEIDEANNGLLALHSFLLAHVPSMHLPLKSIISYQGSTFVVSADTNVDTEVGTDNQTARLILQEASEKLNVVPHVSVSQDSPSDNWGTMSVGLDAKGRYIVDGFQNALPLIPTQGQDNVAALNGQAFRPEFVQTFQQPLNADVFTDALDSSVADQATQDLVTAAEFLQSKVIPSLAEYLDAVYGANSPVPIGDKESQTVGPQTPITVSVPKKASSLGKRKEGDTGITVNVDESSADESSSAEQESVQVDSLPLIELLHQYGINDCFLPQLRDAVTTEWIKDLIASEIVAQSISSVFWKVDSAANALNVIFGGSDETNAFWTADADTEGQAMTPIKVALSKDNVTLEASDDVRSLMSTVTPSSLLDRLCLLLGLQLSKDATAMIESTASLSDAIESAITSEWVECRPVVQQYSVTPRAGALLRQGKVGEALVMMEQQLEARQNALGENSRSLVYPLTRIATVYKHLRQVEKAEESNLRAIELLKNNRRPDDQRQIAIVYRNTGAMFEALNMYERAQTIITEGLSTLKLNVANPFELELDALQSLVAIELVLTLANVLRTATDYLASERQYLRCINLLKRRAALVAQSDASLLSMRDRKSSVVFAGVVHREFAEMLKTKRSLEEAHKQFERSMDLFSASCGKMSVDYAMAMKSYGLLHLIQGKPFKAEEIVQEALQILLEVLDEDTPQVASALEDIGMVVMNLARSKEAEQYYLRSLQINQNVYGDHENTILANLQVSEVYTESGLAGKGMEHVQIAEKMYEALHRGDANQGGKPDLLLARIYMQKSQVCAGQRNYDDCLSNLVMALDVYDAVLPEYAKEKFSALLSIAKYSQYTGDLSVTLIYVQRALEICKYNPSSPTSWYESVLESILKLYRMTGNGMATMEFLEAELQFWSAVAEVDLEQEAVEGDQTLENKMQEQARVVNALYLKAHVLQAIYLQTGDKPELLAEMCQCFETIRDLDMERYERECESSLLRIRLTYARMLSEQGKLEEAFALMENTVKEYCQHDVITSKSSSISGYVEDSLHEWFQIAVKIAGEDMVEMANFLRRELVVRREMLGMEPLAEDELQNVEKLPMESHYPGAERHYCKCLCNMAAVLDKTGNVDASRKLGYMSLDLYRKAEVRNSAPITEVALAFNNHAAFLREQGDVNEAWEVIKDGKTFSSGLSKHHPTRKQVEELYDLLKKEQTAEEIEEVEEVEEVYGFSGSHFGGLGGAMGMGGGGLGGVQILGGDGSGGISMEDLGQQMFGSELALMHDMGLTDDSKNVQALLTTRGNVQLAIQILFSM